MLINFHCNYTFSTLFQSNTFKIDSLTSILKPPDPSAPPGILLYIFEWIVEKISQIKNNDRNHLVSTLINRKIFLFLHQKYKCFFRIPISDRYIPKLLTYHWTSPKLCGQWNVYSLFRALIFGTNSVWYLGGGAEAQVKLQTQSTTLAYNTSVYISFVGLYKMRALTPSPLYWHPWFRASSTTE